MCSLTESDYHYMLADGCMYIHMCFNRGSELDGEPPINMAPVLSEEKIDRSCDSVDKDPPRYLHMHLKSCFSIF